MKQTPYGLILLTGLALFGAYTLFASPRGPDASAQKSGRSVGKSIPKGEGFDFYVLALSWSPTYCQDSQARTRDAVQCAGPRPFAFVVHGLWPQFERGYPRACRTDEPRPTPAQARDMLDIMPSPRLVQHEWEQHGTCSGLSVSDYLRVTRLAAQAVVIPTNYASAPDWRRVSAGEIEAAFIAANPGLREDGISVARRGNNLSEVRLCLSLDLKPRACREVDEDGVSSNTRLAMPPSRG